LGHHGVSLSLLSGRRLVDVVYYSLQIFEPQFAPRRSIDERLPNCVNGKPDSNCGCEDRLSKQMEFVGIFDERSLQTAPE
jgi:hypothetical protein